jgi:hypothetical protein
MTRSFPQSPKPQISNPKPSTSVSQAPLRIAMTRSFPGNWAVWRFEDEDQVYILEREFGVKKPSRRILLEVCKDIIKARSKSGQ